MLVTETLHRAREVGLPKTRQKVGAVANCGQLLGIRYYGGSTGLSQLAEAFRRGPDPVADCRFIYIEEEGYT